MFLVRKWPRADHYFVLCIVNSTSNLNATGFSDGFSASVISRIDSIGGGMGGEGGWGAEGGIKQPFGLKVQCFTFSI